MIVTELKCQHVGSFTNYLDVFDNRIVSHVVSHQRFHCYPIDITRNAVYGFFDMNQTFLVTRRFS